jgi:cell fate (sporulation/competence/biofilm development) regulator YlbF (YheA/YmcA/DUF963 family)
MLLNEDITTAAQLLGKALRKDSYLRDYLEAVERLKADSEASELEARLYRLFEQLTARQQAGERLSREEVDSFYALRNQVQANQLVAERDSFLQGLKPYLAEIADEISGMLGVDYTELAKANQ